MEKRKYERPVIQKLNSGMINKFGSATDLSPLTEIDGVPVKRLVEKFGSPLFVFSERQIRAKYNEVVNTFTTRYPKVKFGWSYKTNYLNAICNIYHQEGSWAEVVSGFEYEKAIQNGVPGNKIIFNGPDKSLEDLQKSIDNNSLIHIDHLDEFYMLSELAQNSSKKPKVAIRVNMDTGVYPMWDRFGFNFENGQAWDAINKIMTNDKFNMVGLHCHIGTFMMAPSAYGVAASKLASLFLRIKNKFGHTLEYIDLGGGLPSQNNLKGAYLPGTDIVPPVEEFAETIASGLLNSDISPEDLPLLIMETGRLLIDEAGYLIGSVLANKRLSTGRRATILDFGLNTLFTSIWYNHKITPAQDISNYKEDMELFGPLCMNIDVVRESIILPPLKKGDFVVAQNVGAYNVTQWMQFITMRPNVVLIDMQGEPHLIRKAENLETINRMELTPEHLSAVNL
ncbi:MAG: diaminopimelate decarboxylase [Bacteroidota bacterium]